MVDRLTCGSLLAFVLVTGAPAWAAEAGDEARSRSHFEIGRGHFRLASFPDAIREFLAAYSLSPRPALLLNIALCHRRMGDLAQTRETYRKYLVAAPVGDPERKRVAGLIAELDLQIAGAQPAPEPEQKQPEKQPEPAPQGLPVGTSVAPIAEPATPLLTAAPAVSADARPRRRRVVLAASLSAGAAVVIAGVVVAVVLSLPSGPPSSDLGHYAPFR